MLEKFHLGDDFLAAVDGNRADGRVGGQALDFGIDLNGQLARGDEDDGLCGEAFDGFLKDGNGERGGFSGAGAGLAEDIDPFQRGESAILNFRGGHEAGVGQGSQDGWRTPSAANASGTGG